MREPSSSALRSAASSHEDEPATVDAPRPVTAEPASSADAGGDATATIAATSNDQPTDTIAGSASTVSDNSADRPWSSSTAAVYSSPPTPPTQPQVNDSIEQLREQQPPTTKPAEEEKEIAQELSASPHSLLPADAERDAAAEEEKTQTSDSDEALQDPPSPLSPLARDDAPFALSSPPSDLPNSSTLPSSSSSSSPFPLPATSTAILPSSESLIHVSIPTSTSPPTPPVLLPVLITRPYLSHPRPYLGGYRHHVSGRVRLHAETQTERRGKGREGVAKAERETQTVEVKTRGVQSGRDVGTQMDKKGEWVNEEDEGGREVVPGVAVPSEVVERAREASAVRLQCWLRVCFSRRRMLQLRAEKERAESAQQEEKQQSLLQREAEQRRQIHRRMHPRSKEDFSLLYQELAAWRQHEAQRISAASATDEERDAAMSLLLSKEVKLLQTIDRLRLVAAKARAEEGTRVRLEAMASPLEWKTTEGDRVEVVTPHVLRAQQLVTLYQGLTLPVKWGGEGGGGEGVGWDARVDVLLNVKYVVQEVGGEGAAEMLQLLEREQEWMQRRKGSAGWKADAALTGLRQRLALLFLHFIQQPAVNPAAALHAQSLTRTTKPAMQQLLTQPLPAREINGHTPTTTEHTLTGHILP